MSEAAYRPPAPPRPLVLVALVACGVLSGAFVGGTTNAINGWISPTYFVTVLRWHEVEDVWRASIAQGIFEGLLAGLLFATAFTAGTALLTHVSCSFGFAFKHLLGILATIYVCWLIGGVAAVGLASLSPEFFRRTFYRVPAESGPMLGYAWVGGSIWGAQLGALVALILGLIVLRANWRRSA